MTTTTAYGVEYRTVGGVLLPLQRTRAMFLKHVLHSWRNLVVTLVQLFVPVFFAVVACLIVRTMPKIVDLPAIELTLRPFEETYVAYRVDDPGDPIQTAVADRYRDIVSTEVRPPGTTD